MYTKNWHLRTAIGDTIGLNGDVHRVYSHLDYFMMMFPNTQLAECVRLTSLSLRSKDKKETTAGEVLKLFGVIILITRF